MPPQYKLTYFDGRAVAETTRFMFAIAKVPYEDKRFPLTFGTPGDFSTIKRPEFDQAKAAGEFDMSMGQLPVLEVDGFKISQSKAIGRFVAQELGFSGSTALEAARVDQLCETVRDIKDAYQKVRGAKGSDAEKKQAMQKWFQEDLPGLLRRTEQSVPPSQGPWLVGSKVSVADILFYHLLAAPKGFFDDTSAAAAAFQDCPRMRSSVEALASNAELKDWLEKRPDTPI